MPPPRRRFRDDEERRSSPPPALADQRPLIEADPKPKAGAFLAKPTRRPLIYAKQIRGIEGKARPGDLIAVHAEDGPPFGYAYFNPRAEIQLRIVRRGPEPPDEAFFAERLMQAVSLRRDSLNLDATTNAYRVIHAESDGFSGLAADRFADFVSLEAFSLSMWQRSRDIAERLLPLLDAKHYIVRPGPAVTAQEGFSGSPFSSASAPEAALIVENGVKYRVQFAGGHKTGFFCDQRDNRRRLAELCGGKSVLDLCCYSGGFSVQAKMKGDAAEVVGVDLDAEPLAWARENANLNQVRCQFVQADAFAYMRDLQSQNRRFDVVVLDPPKLIRNRAEYEEGAAKHYDLNKLAAGTVASGGLLLTCSCAGLMPTEEFLRIVFQACRSAGRDVKLLETCGAAADHPISPDWSETEYFKSHWLYVV
jgi:23S rRNA (cytosine1962-C5)-methyltransferase